jgi:hypothetical protein
MLETRQNIHAILLVEVGSGSTEKQKAYHQAYWSIGNKQRVELSPSTYSLFSKRACNFQAL